MCLVSFLASLISPVSHLMPHVIRLLTSHALNLISQFTFHTLRSSSTPHLIYHVSSQISHVTLLQDCCQGRQESDGTGSQRAEVKGGKERKKGVEVKRVIVEVFPLPPTP
ncbi:hypothetical protein PoB_001508300 [Plakobranchus ocellatus]|uniref:Uncharacterized protein n=1 Tax=Plakobranchus ocellatus TaxID=259542 RepID=A0AAV3Z1D1_9GAST|nr:hypothetical protein PoB_001508300 [Plakobranchus ocellatus]